MSSLKSSAKMKASLLRQFNTVPDVEQRDVPRASGNEVVIHQSYTGICHRDILTLKGRFPRTRLPVVPGHELSGRVVEVGESVSKFRVGDRVSGLIYIPCGRCRLCREGRENLCRTKKTLGEGVDGSYAPFVRTNEDSVVPVPDGVDEESAVMAACVTGMMVHALRYRARLSRGETVLVTGAGGGVGTHAVQIAKAMGARVIAATSSSWKEEKIFGLGADAVVHSPKMGQTIKEQTAGEGVDIVVETVGGPTFRESLKSLNFGGRLLVIGNVDSSTVELPLGYTILKGLEVVGSISSTRQNMIEALAMAQKGQVKAVVDRRIRLEEIGSAYGAMENRSTFGRVLIDLNDSGAGQ